MESMTQHASQSNQFVFGGLVLIIVQSLSRLLESSLYYIATGVFRLIFVTVDVDNSQDSYSWIVSYLSHLHSQGQITTWGTMTVLNQITKASSRKSDSVASSKSTKGSIHFVPGAGLHFLRVGWLRFVVIHKTVAETSGRGGEGQSKEVIWMGTIGLSPSFFRDFIERARVHSFSHDEESTIIFVQDGYRTSWKKGLTKSKRAWESVILDGTLSEDVYNECKTFLESREWYMELGVPYRRSFLLESPPGCGKSSFIQALAGRLNYDICFLSLSASDLSDQDLAEQLRATPPESITVLEELDAAFPDRTKISAEEKKKLKNKSLTMGGLLNALDGLVACEGRLLFFTTNHLEKLDPALMRPGRIDRIVSLKLASPKQIEKLFLKFHPKMESVARLYARTVPSGELSMAQIQGHLLRFRDRPVDAVSDVPVFLREVRDAQKRRKDYETKLRAAMAEKKKTEPEEENKIEEEAVVEEKKVEVAVASADEEKDIPLSQSVQSLTTVALEAQVSEGLRKRKGKKKKKKNHPDPIPLNQTH